MTTPPVAHLGWTPRLALVTEPQEQASQARKSVVVIAVCGLGIAFGLWVGFVAELPIGFVVAAVAVVAVIIWLILASNYRAASKLTGDDLTLLVIANEGLATPGGLAVTWPEISEVVYTWKDLQNSRRVGGKIAEKAMERGTMGFGSTASLQVRLRDYAAVKARATSALQRGTLMGPMLGDPGFVNVGLHGRTDDEIRAVIAQLTTATSAHQIPLTREP